MNRILITGDTHGEIDVKKIKKLQESDRKLDMTDYLIICGDAGFIWDNETLSDGINLYKSFGTNILFVDGNHENFDLLSTFPVETWNGGKVHKIADNIFHLMRGQVFEICGRKILAVGGANSTDKESRVEHISWWRDEVVSSNDVAEAFNNLKNHNYQVDYVISHSPSSEFLDLLYDMFTQCGEEVPYYLQKKITHSISSDNLQVIKEKIAFKRWFCGHIHIDEQIKNYRVLYRTFCEI